MKKILLLALASLLMLSVCAFPASAAELREIVDEEWDDYENPNVKFYDVHGNEHTCDVCATVEDAKDALGFYSWFGGPHLYQSSGHFAHVGAYCEITLKNATKFKYATQYRGPAKFYSQEATIFINNEEVAKIGTDVLNGEDLTARAVLWESPDLDPAKEYVIRIQNTHPKPETFEGTDEEWLASADGKRLPFDLFLVSYMSDETDPPMEPEWTQPPEETEPQATEAPATGAATGEAAGTEDNKTEEKKGCGSAIGASALVLAAVLAAPVAFSRKRK